MRVLVLTAMYPTAARPAWGTFVRQQVESLVEAGIDVDVLAFDGGGSVFNYLRAGQLLRNRMAGGSYDLIHAHYGLTLVPALMQRRLPVVVTYHGSDLLGEFSRGGRYTAAGRLKVGLGVALGRFAAARIIVAEVQRPRLKGLPAETIPMGVDLDTFRPGDRAAARRNLGLSADRRYILFLADPDNPVKRHGLAVEAVELVAGEGVDIELLTVHGVPHEEVPGYMNAADALILTSAHEASPCVVKEALACNLPVVATPVGDVAERLQGAAGSTVRPPVALELAAGLIEVLGATVEFAGRRAVETISLPRTAQRVIRVYEKVLDGCGRRTPPHPETQARPTKDP